MVAVLAHALGMIRREIFHQPCNPEHLAAIALYHDATEILTGDMPTPIKYQNPEIRQAYKQVESLAARRLLEFLPPALRPAYAGLLDESAAGEDYRLVKAADKLSALVKCMEERKAGNNEFISAEKQTRAILDASPLPEVKYFLDKFIPAFELTLDELGTIDEEGKA